MHFLPDPGDYKEWAKWAKSLVIALTRAEVVTVLAPPQYEIARLPKPNKDGMFAVVIDGGYKLVYTYGGVWKYVHDNSAV